MMTDEHPEQLLDRALDGDLGTGDRAALDVHLAACAACALHLAVGVRLRSATPGAAARDEALNRVAIAGALAQVRAPRTRSSRQVGWMSWRLAAGSVLLVAGLAAAAAVSIATARAPRKAAMTPVPSPGADHGAPEVSGAGPPEAPAQSHQPARSTKIAPSAAALFARAGDLRREGRADRAIDTYHVLQRRYPRTREANLSFALAGRLQLEHDRPARALTEFDRYLTIDAEFAEEALAGRGEALRRLGRYREERAAWRSLLARFPASIYAGQARSRLAALDPASLSPAIDAPGRR